VDQLLARGVKNVAAKDCGAHSVVIGKHGDNGVANEGASWAFLTVTAAPHQLFTGFG
jgi:hypothetical protein